MSEMGAMIFICGLKVKKGTSQEVVNQLRDLLRSLSGNAGFRARYLILPAKEMKYENSAPFNLFMVEKSKEEMEKASSNWTKGSDGGSVPEPQRFGGGDQPTYEAQFEDRRDPNPPPPPPGDEDLPY